MKNKGYWSEIFSVLGVVVEEGGEVLYMGAVLDPVDCASGGEIWDGDTRLPLSVQSAVAAWHEDQS